MLHNQQIKNIFQVTTVFNSILSPPPSAQADNMVIKELELIGLTVLKKSLVMLASMGMGKCDAVCTKWSVKVWLPGVVPLHSSFPLPMSLYDGGGDVWLLVGQMRSCCMIAAQLSAALVML